MENPLKPRTELKRKLLWYVENYGLSLNTVRRGPRVWTSGANSQLRIGKSDPPQFRTSVQVIVKKPNGNLRDQLLKEGIVYYGVASDGTIWENGKPLTATPKVDPVKPTATV